MPWSTKYVTDWLSYVYNPLYNPLKFNVDLTWLNYIYNDHASLIIIFIISPFSTARVYQPCTDCSPHHVASGAHTANGFWLRADSFYGLHRQTIAARSHRLWYF